MSTQASVNGVSVHAIVDTGATISCVAKSFVAEQALQKENAILVEVGNGATLFTLGTTDLTLQFGSKILTHKAYVLDTNAFEAVLGMDFLSSPRCTGIITFPSPPKLMVDGELFILQELPNTSAQKLCRIFKTEAYTLIEDVKKNVLEDLGIQKEKNVVDMFANHKNHQESLYCTRQNSAFFYNWESLLKENEFLWANPPFSQLDKVLTKVALEPCKMILVTPNWPGSKWMRILDKVAMKQSFVPPETPLYKRDSQKKALPPPPWETVVSVIDTSTARPAIDELDPKVVKYVKRITREWGRPELLDAMRAYPRIVDIQNTMEKEDQFDSVVVPEIPETPGVSPIKGRPSEVFSESSLTPTEILLDSLSLVDVQFSHTDHKVMVPKVLMLDMGDWSDERNVEAKPHCCSQVKEKELSELAILLQQRILHIEREMGTSSEHQEELFEDIAMQGDTENLHGEFEKDLARFAGQPKLVELLTKYKEAFVPLPPPEKGCKLAVMDLELKEEFRGQTLRQKCWPMPKEDALEIEKQVQELVDAGLVEPFPVGEFPKHCSPTFLVDKRESKTRRMVGQYVKLNKRTKPHAGFLPNMEEMVENLAKCRFKSKLDLRSGFWQIGLSDRAKELTVFTTPNGRCFRWLCMPFGLQGAPGVFQEMMEILVSKVKMSPLMKDILLKGFIGAFFDDCGVGTQTEEQHLAILEHFLKVCMDNHVRVKLSKCEFMKEEIEYLGYHIGWGTWKPTAKKVEALLKTEIKCLADLKRFLGAMNFYRRHIPRFSFSSALLSDLTKKGVKWNWTPEHQKHFEELKAKLASQTLLGVPQTVGEMVLITDSSDKGGGGTLFQWQKMEKEQIPPKFRTWGVNGDGTLKHNYPPDYRLVPIGHWNWKWNPTRQRYMTYEQELLSGVLTFASQFRILAHLPIIWLCDNEALKTFLDKEPPSNPRLRRWYCFLSQFQLHVCHIPGIKNEMCDWLSRQDFDALTGMESDLLAQEAFIRMDRQLDLGLQAIRLLVHQEFKFCGDDYAQSAFKHIWESLEPNQMEFFGQRMFFRTETELFCERKLVIPTPKLPEVLKWSHHANGHPSPDRTVWFFLQHFFADLTRKELLEMSKSILGACHTCLLAKPNTQLDRGLVASLPIPQLSNDILYVDFIAMDAFNYHDYVLTIVDALTRFVMFIPCTKNISGEGTLKTILKEWISHFGKPREILSDNDVRFSQEKGFYQSAFKALGIDVHFGIPRHPQSNGLCERINRSFLQNCRAMSIDCKTMDWPKLCPFVAWTMNSQISSSTGFSPSELFLGRPSWKFTKVPEPCSNPTVESWLEDQLILQESASKRLAHLREVSLRRNNKGRTRSHYKIGEYVLVHKNRWPQKKISKLESPWLGPFQIKNVFHNSLNVVVSPSLGGVVKVSLSMVKRWSEVQSLEESLEEEPVFHNTEENEMEAEEMSKEEMEEEGYFNVEAVLKHKYAQGWRFLVHWEGYPIANATWEPLKSFVQPTGVVNSKLKEYCEAHGLQEVLFKGLKH